MGINLRTKPVSEMDICELPYNDCYVKERQAMYRDYDTDMSARDLIRAAYRARNENFEPDWECPNCGFGVAKDYVACPHCGSELDWSRAGKPSKEFKKFMARL